MRQVPEGDNKRSGHPAALFQFDGFTQLPNRAYLINKVESSIAFYDEQEAMIALLLIDVDALSRLNDLFGIDIDDRLMLQISDGIRSLIPDDALLARVGNYQLAVVLEHMQTPDAAERIARQLQHLFSEPFSIDEHLFYVTSSIGVSLFPLDADNAYSLLKIAENTMRRIKREGKNLYAFSHKYSNESCKVQVQLMRDLPSAIESGEIFFEYQCQYDQQKQRCSGAELLARWEHPELGTISPSTFVTLAEQSGMIGPMTVRALAEASTMFQSLESIGRTDVSLSVNISPLFMMSKDFIETVRFMCEHYALDAQPLHFEITEETLIDYSDTLFETLETLRTMTIGIEIDDFGTGFASLRYLMDLPIDTLKIDRSFVEGIDRDSKKRLMYKAVVDMAKALNISVITEGVETEGEAAVATMLGPVVVQGYFYSRPLRADAFLSKLAAEQF